jgi:pimeloyl-ACP methyl ester carboxylesterase
MARVWDSEAPATVLFFHGTPDSRLLGPAHSDDLGGALCRLITFDRPGYGLSDRRRGRALSETVSDVSQLLDELGVERCIVAAWSAGAAFALASAAGLPDRVEAVRLVAPLAPFSSEVGSSQLSSDQAGRLSLLSRLPLNHVQLARVVLASIRGEARRRRRDPEAFLRRLADRSPADRVVLEEPEVRAVLVADIEAALQDGAEGWADDVSVMVTPWGVDLSAVTQTVQLWHGLDDVDVLPVASRFFAERMADAELVEVEDAGHLVLFSLWPQLLAPLGR